MVRAQNLMTYPIYFYYLRRGGYVFARLCLFVCLSVCLSVCLGVSKITQKVMDGSFWNFLGMLGMAKTTNFSILGGDPEGIPDSGSLWNFPQHCFQWGI